MLAVIPALALLAATLAGLPPARIELRSESWDFATDRKSWGSLAPDLPLAPFLWPADASAGFTIRMTLDVHRFPDDATILDVPGVLRVRLRRHDPKDRSRQNYPAFPMPDGTVPVLEATLQLRSAEHPDWTAMTIGAPLGMLASSLGAHEVVLHYTGVRWSMYIDGELTDKDLPFGAPTWSERPYWRADVSFTRKADLFMPALVPARKPGRARTAPVQYWTPPGHNTWVGDVATLYFRGRYHVFYLFDRRHHSSKFGAGGHYFEHLSTADLRSWTEHEAATPLDEPWETIGTGTPFELDGKLCLAYGLHTERFYPDARTTRPAQLAYLESHGRTGTFDRTTPGVPIGATYAVSRDGVAEFAKSWRFFHPCRNPSVYRDPSGALRLLANYQAKGTWESASIDGGWRCVRPDFPPGGDCTVYFRRGTYDYVMGGFKDLWSKPADAPESAYRDVVREGLDVYDGLNVPAVTEVQGGRWLMAGWTSVRGWGGQLVIRELLQDPDGRLGAKWLDELMPTTGPPTLAAHPVTGPTAVTPERSSFLLTFLVLPGLAKGRAGIAFLPAEGEAGSCELQLRPGERRVQFGPGSRTDFAGPEKTLREGGAPHAGGNYAVDNLLGVDRPFPVRVLVTTSPKLGGTLIDAEIAGRRTMLTYRPELVVKSLLLRIDGAEIRDPRIAAVTSSGGE
jgi:hypothetical protein